MPASSASVPRANGQSGELSALSERLRWLTAFRIGVVAVAALHAVAEPAAWGWSPAPVIGAAGLVALLGLMTARPGRGRAGALWALNGLLLADGVVLALVTVASGGMASPLRHLIVLHLVVVALLASYRTGTKLAIWHSLLLFALNEAKEGGLLPGTPSEGGDSVLLFVALAWVATIVTATASAVSERELRRRRADSEALAAFARVLGTATEPVAVARVLLDHVRAEAGARRCLVLARRDDRWWPLAAAGGAVLPAEVWGIGDDSRGVSGVPDVSRGLADRALDAGGAVLVRRLAPAPDGSLDGALPGAVNVAAVRLVAEGRTIGLLVTEHGSAAGAGLERRVVDLLERSAAQAALALANAWLHQTLEEHARTDGLTGLANRRRLDRALDEQIAACARDGAPISLALIDLDHFKQLNDNHGHVVGDDVLRVVGATLQGQRRPLDTPARFGGEEFALLLPRTDAATARRMAEELRQALAAAPSPVPVTASVGVCTAPSGWDDALTLVAAADEALYEAKRTGRNRVASRMLALPRAGEPLGAPAQTDERNDPEETATSPGAEPAHARTA